MGSVGNTCFDYSSTFIADLFSPKQSTDQKSTVFVVEDQKFISHPVFIKQEERSNHTPICIYRIEIDHSGNANEEALEEESGMVHLYSFNTIVVFPEKEEKIQNLKELLYFFSMKKMFLFDTLAKSLEFEEKRQNFVSKQVHQILKLDYEFRAAIKNLLKDVKKDEPFRDEVRESIMSIQRSLLK